MKLKPCPTCGNNKILRVTSVAVRWRRCRVCGLTTGEYKTDKDADAAWNKRPGEQAVAEECAKIIESFHDPAFKIIANEFRSRFGGKQ